MPETGAVCLVFTASCGKQGFRPPSTFFWEKVGSDPNWCLEGGAGALCDITMGGTWRNSRLSARFWRRSKLEISFIYAFLRQSGEVYCCFKALPAEVNFT